MPEQSPRDLLSLPAVPGAAEVEELVFDGEVVVEEAAPEPSPPAPVRAVIVVVRVVVVVVRHERTRTVARHAAYIPAGAVAFYRGRQQGKTLAQRMAQDLAQRGEHEKALAVLAHEAQERHKRHERTRARVDMALTVIRHWRPVTVVAAGGMLAIGMAVGSPAAPFHLTAEVIRGAVTGLRIACLAAPFATAAVLWRIGKREAAWTPEWSAGALPEGDGRGLVVSADGIVAALRHLGLPKLDKAFRDGWQPHFHTTPVRDGEGYFSVFSVPMGVTPAMIADKNDVFARNLHRAQSEVWPTDAERGKIAPAGYVALWVANPGVLDRPAPEWPLLHEGTADVFQGVPAGVSPRGDAMRIRIVANNMVCGGIMGVGKSNACRVVMLGAALDPLAELWVHVFAYNGDFDCYGPRLARYEKGAEEAQLMYAMDSLHELYRSVGEREQMLSDIGAKKVTRAVAERHPELRPRLALFSECHELFGSKDYGEEATELAVNVMRRARKTAIWLGFDTQDARKDAIPPKIVSLVSVNVCFAVKSWRANDGFLGDGSFQAGIRATELRANRDIGRSVTTGVSDAQFELLKWHYIFSDDDTGQDDAKPVIERAMRNVAPGTPVAGNSPAPAIVVRDLLADLAEVIDGPDRVRLAELAPRLRKLAPAWPPYRGLDGVQLQELLDREGVAWVKPKNVPQLDPAELRKALTGRGELAVPCPRTASRSPPGRAA